jgi:hypothetical protein
MWKAWTFHSGNEPLISYRGLRKFHERIMGLGLLLSSHTCFDKEVINSKDRVPGDTGQSLMSKRLGRKT